MRYDITSGEVWRTPTSAACCRLDKDPRGFFEMAAALDWKPVEAFLEFFDEENGVDLLWVADAEALFDLNLVRWCEELGPGEWVKAWAMFGGTSLTMLSYIQDSRHVAFVQEFALGRDFGEDEELGSTA